MDTVLDSLDWFGRYQKVQFLLLMLPILDCALSLLSFIFIGRTIEHRCAEVSSLYPHLNSARDFSYLFDVTNQTELATNMTLKVTYGDCKVTVTNQSVTIFSATCPNGYEYSEPRERSFATEWDLVCDKQALSEVSQTVMSLGMVVGASMFASLADKYGRKPVYVFSHILFFAVHAGTAFVPNFAAFVVMRFLLGAFQQGIGIVSCVMLVELLPTARRAISSQVGSFIWSSCLLLLGMVCYLCRHLTWRHTQMVLAACSCYCLVEWWLVEESLRWLTANGKTQEAERLIEKAAKANGKDPQKILKLYREETGASILLLSSPTSNISTDGKAISVDGDGSVSGERRLLKSHEDKTVAADSDALTDRVDPPQEHQFSIIFKNRKIMLLLAISCFMWFTDSLAYSGLLMTSTSLADDMYLGFVLNVLVEFPAALIFALFINRSGRRYLAVVSHLVGGVCLLGAALLSYVPAAASIPGVGAITLVVNLMGKFGISLGFAVLWLFTPEMFPTTIRSTAFGISSVAARIGGMIAPYSRTLARHTPWAPGVVFAIPCLLVPLCVQLLPETKGQELPQTTSDMTFTGKAMTSTQTIVVKKGCKKKGESSEQSHDQV